MPPGFAARIPDPITHDGLVPSGVIAPTGPISMVIIEGLPVAHMGDIAVCTGMTSLGPMHPPIPAPPFGTPIVVGSATVLADGRPVARWVTSLDAAGCTVFLGDPKMMAMRKVLVGG